MKSQFSHCIGALDAKHIRIKCPANSGSQYFNWKKFYSVVLQAVVDSNARFIFIEVGAPGRQHDSCTFQSSDFCKALSSRQLQVPKEMRLPSSKVPFMFIADGAYGISQFILKPFRKGNLLKSHQIFNKKIVNARGLDGL